jgi:hypothetical protein
VITCWIRALFIDGSVTGLVELFGSVPKSAKGSGPRKVALATMEGEYVDLHHLEYALYFEVLRAYTVGPPEEEEEEEEEVEVEADMDDGCDGVDGTSLSV